MHVFKFSEKIHINSSEVKNYMKKIRNLINNFENNLNTFEPELDEQILKKIIIYETDPKENKIETKLMQKN